MQEEPLASSKQTDLDHEPLTKGTATSTTSVGSVPLCSEPADNGVSEMDAAGLGAAMLSAAWQALDEVGGTLLLGVLAEHVYRCVGEASHNLQP